MYVSHHHLYIVSVWGCCECVCVYEKYNIYCSVLSKWEKMQCISQMWFSIFDTSYSDDAKTLKTIVLGTNPKLSVGSCSNPTVYGPWYIRRLHLCTLKYRGYWCIKQFIETKISLVCIWAKKCVAREQCQLSANISETN